MGTDCPETTNASDKNKCNRNQQARIGCKYLSGNKLPRIKLIRGKLFPDRYLLPMTAYLCCSLSRWLSLVNRYVGESDRTNVRCHLHEHILFKRSVKGTTV